MDPTLLTASATLLAGAVVWAVRLEGRLNAHDTLFVERAKQSEDRHEELKARLVRIENKLDQSLKFNGASNR